MSTYSYQPRGVCAKMINFELEDNLVHNIYFVGGCPGNLQAISKLLEGQDVNWVIAKLKGNTCGNKATSCADQLAQALEIALHRQNN
ncbi:MAG: TIGR03905 family TSCPD domain-containing protein [Desulfovibrio sp.]|nr:TIGR03905 family TSCPD domain-containing protein [Desulfovibrio sp.]